MYKNQSLPNIIVFCHLRWEFVKQRPQHLISRLAQKANILFVEEPIEFDRTNHGTANIIKVGPTLTVVQPRIEPNNFDDLSKIIKLNYLSNGTSPIIWFYSPAFLPILKFLDYSVLIYDCMDELSAFKGASKEISKYEKELLSKADIVFTGGRSLFESKRKLTKNIFCFPSSVDKRHFQKAISPKTKIPSDIKQVKRPIVGYYGVIDERIDLGLLKKVSKKNPGINFVMIGPIAKIDEKDLPKDKNIHYLGMKPYDLLPNYLKGFDVAMMPFSINKSTRFISPTKTLEFMAAQKPIISTPVYDVKRQYSKEVSIINNANAFTDAIKYYLSENATAKSKRLKREEQVINNTSWDNTVETMTAIITKQLKKRMNKLNTEVPISIKPVSLVQPSGGVL
jgi:glycosyltransferase involved in cell wall biosynthesis